MQIRKPALLSRNHCHVSARSGCEAPASRWATWPGSARGGQVPPVPFRSCHENDSSSILKLLESQSASDSQVCQWWAATINSQQIALQHHSIYLWALNIKQKTVSNAHCLMRDRIFTIWQPPKGETDDWISKVLHFWGFFWSRACSVGVRGTDLPR